MSAAFGGAKRLTRAANPCQKSAAATPVPGIASRTTKSWRRRSMSMLSTQTVSGMNEFLSVSNREAPASDQIIHPADVIISRPIECTYCTVHIQRSARLHQDEFTGSNQCGNEHSVHRRGIQCRVLLLV